MYEPQGFVTDFRPKDFDDRVEHGPSASWPRLGVTPARCSEGETGTLTYEVFDAADIYAINDNHGRMFLCTGAGFSGLRVIPASMTTQRAT